MEHGLHPRAEQRPSAWEGSPKAPHLPQIEMTNARTHRPSVATTSSQHASNALKQVSTSHEETVVGFSALEGEQMEVTDSNLRQAPQC